MSTSSRFTISQLHRRESTMGELNAKSRPALSRTGGSVLAGRVEAVSLATAPAFHRAACCLQGRKPATIDCLNGGEVYERRFGLPVASRVSQNLALPVASACCACCRFP
jgi:hypothetical protein